MTIRSDMLPTAGGSVKRSLAMALSYNGEWLR
jgi:hypothetical protein